MDHSWRPPPPPPSSSLPGNICPICSISHFPFCPPLPPPRFHYSQQPPPPPPPNDYYYHQPPPPPPPHFDHPFSNHPPPSLNYNYDDLRRPPMLYDTTIPNPTLDIPNYYNYNRDSYDNPGIKRIKIETINNNRVPFPPTEIGPNERILKLIHDHGNAANTTIPGPALPKVEFNGEVRDDFGLKRRREMTGKNNVVYDQRDGFGQSLYAPIQNSLPHSLDYGRQQHHIQQNHNFVSPSVPTDVNQAIDINAHNSQPLYKWSESKGQYVANSYETNFAPVEVPRVFHTQPPLPNSPPPPLPIDPPRKHFPSPPKNPSLFPVTVGSSADTSTLRSPVPQNLSSAQVYYSNNNAAGHHGSALSSAEEFYTHQSSSEKHVGDVQPYPLRHLPSEKPNIINASHIFKQPHRASRPDHFVIILRGLPGSGKSYLAKVLRDIEIENGGEAPRIHSMDDYFITEVEKAEDSELSKSSGSLRGKRQVMKRVMEYCYEPEMEEAYRASMLKAFKKTLDEGVYSFIIVDDRNLRVADFAQFWATAKRSGFEVYIMEAAYKDPAGCAARNVHNFSLDDILKMAGQWEEAPSLYLKMDIKSLLHGDGFDESGIQEVDMDMEDDDVSLGSDVKSPQDNVKDQVDNPTPHDAGPLKDVKHLVPNHSIEEVNHFSKSKWSNDLDGSKSDEAGGNKKASALSGLIQAYSKEGKSVRWGDQGGNVGFSISATRKTNARSLVIGPGSGYNLKSNPLSEEEYLKPAKNAIETKSQNVFQEQIRAERESFKAIFDKRRHRIGGFNVDEE